MPPAASAPPVLPPGDHTHATGADHIFGITPVPPLRGRASSAASGNLPARLNTTAAPFDLFGRPARPPEAPPPPLAPLLPLTIQLPASDPRVAHAGHFLDPKDRILVISPAAPAPGRGLP